MPSTIDILAAVEASQLPRYDQYLAGQADFSAYCVNDLQEAQSLIADREHHFDVIILDNAFEETLDFISGLRQHYPRLLIILVDEEADFGMPGQADDMSTDPFNEDDLARRIRKLLNDRRAETLRSDSLPAVRDIARQLAAATGRIAKQEAATEVVRNLGYDYVAYYQIAPDQTHMLKLRAQSGPQTISSIAPQEAGPDDLMGWVAQTGQSRIAGPTDSPTHPLVARGRLGAVVCVPVAFNGVNHGVMAVCNDRPGSIEQDNILLLELVCTQLAAALGGD